MSQINIVGGNELGKKKEHKSIIQSKISEFYVKNLNQEKSQSRTQIHYILIGITGEEERTSQPLCIYNGIHLSAILNPNNDAYLFIEKIRVTSCEITKLPLTLVPEFHGLRSFKTESLHCYTSPRCYSALSL